MTDELCTLPPPGWECTRQAGHDGPCAAIPAPISVPPQHPPTIMPYSIGSDVWPGASKLAEEAAELAQVLAKLMAYPHTPHPDGTDLRVRLVDELGDVTAAVRFFIDTNPIEPEAVARRARHKLDRFRRWHRERT